MLRTLPMPNDVSRTALDFAHRLLSRPASEQPALEALLEELAAAFGAPACGLVVLPDGAQSFRHPDEPATPGGPWPWEDDPSILDNAARPPGAAPVTRDGRPTLLITHVAGTAGHWVLYVEAERDFSDA